MINVPAFNTHIQSLINDDEQACYQLKKSSEIIISHYFEKKKLELNWVADKNRIIENEVFFDIVIKEFLKNLKNRKQQLVNFEEYKNILLQTAENELNDMFNYFYLLLHSGNNRGWEIVYNKLSILTLKWYTNRKYNFQNDLEDIYQESCSILFENITSSKTTFKDSCLLKSYYFKIIDNVSKENYRKEKKILKNELQENIIDRFVSSDNDEKEEQLQFLIKELNKLPKTDFIILNEHYINKRNLEDIAQQLNISYINCRVRSHRAVRRLREKMMNFN